MSDTRDVHHYAAPGIEVTWDATRCLHFAECVRGLPQVFDPSTRPWVQPEHAEPMDVAEVIRRCPTGALQYHSAAEPDEVGPIPTDLRPTGWGPLLIHGRLRLVSETGADVSETRMAACACGHTARAPHCDGTCRVSAD